MRRVAGPKEQHGFQCMTRARARNTRTLVVPGTSVVPSSNARPATSPRPTRTRSYRARSQPARPPPPRRLPVHALVLPGARAPLRGSARDDVLVLPRRHPPAPRTPAHAPAPAPRPAPPRHDTRRRTRHAAETENSCSTQPPPSSSSSPFLPSLPVSLCPSVVHFCSAGRAGRKRNHRGTGKRLKGRKTKRTRRGQATASGRGATPAVRRLPERLPPSRSSRTRHPRSFPPCAEERAEGSRSPRSRSARTRGRSSVRRRRRG